MIRKYIVDTRVCPFQADGQFEDGSYFHIRYRNSKVFIGVYPVPTFDNQNTTAKAFYSESWSSPSLGLHGDTMEDVQAIQQLSNFYSRYLEETTHLSEE
ncbi:hypothetical protein [Marinobacter sp.]|jgi:hypothetical protein|uniref:hypothetical protein n=1 Tax=Marinobacter sp. TaxID=50741 RepID=UPI0023541168|nr:hypothetical protein [Marinobacter sp.]|tara:strand:- start:437 stop:733 length:297 start_codon:yes stop_codon:yes gene_type:complete